MIGRQFHRREVLGTRRLDDQSQLLARNRLAIDLDFGRRDRKLARFLRRKSKVEFPAAVSDLVHHAVDDRNLVRIERLLAEESDVEILHAVEFGRLRVLHIIDNDAIDDRLPLVDFVLAQAGRDLRFFGGVERGGQA